MLLDAAFANICHVILYLWCIYLQTRQVNSHSLPFFLLISSHLHCFIQAPSEEEECTGKSDEVGRAEDEHEQEQEMEEMLSGRRSR